MDASRDAAQNETRAPDNPRCHGGETSEESCRSCEGGEHTGGEVHATPTCWRRMDDTTPAIKIFDGDGGENGVNSSRSARVGCLVVVTGEEKTHKATRLFQVCREE